MDALAKQVDAIVRSRISPSMHMVVGLSGGIDSVALLHILGRQLRLSKRMTAIHINHQLSAHATEWAAFCRRLCRRLGIKLRVVKVDVARGNSTESAARKARHAVFAGSGADVVVLAHNRDDQAETILLMLLRGSGPRGLAAMPVLKPADAGMPAVLRPLLETPRKAIEGYAHRHKLQWIEDDSNQDRAFLRNFLRHDVIPMLERRIPEVASTLARSARHQAEASDLLDALAIQDIGRNLHEPRLSLEQVQKLAPHRARNALRYFLRCNNVLMPDSDRLDELLRQAIMAKDDARVCLDLGGVEVRRFKHALHVVRQLPCLEKSFELVWSGRGVLQLPQLGGSLQLVRRKGAGIAESALRARPLLVRVRRGGEVMRLKTGGRSRTVRNLLQEAELPPWLRERLPFLYLGNELAAVPGLGIDVKFQPSPDAQGLLPVWLPA